jgi:hypothetical protein
MTLIDKACYERGCACYDPRVDHDGVEVVQREWVGLTDEEVSKLIGNEIGFNSCCGWETDYTRAVEAKLKEKNT